MIPLLLNKSLKILAENSELCYTNSNSQNFSLTQEIFCCKAVHMGILS